MHLRCWIYIKIFDRTIANVAEMVDNKFSGEVPVLGWNVVAVRVLFLRQFQREWDTGYDAIHPQNC